MKLEATRMVSFSIKRRMTDPIGPAVVTVSNERRNTVQALLGQKTPSPRPSPQPSRSPSPSRAAPPPGTGGLSLQDISRRTRKPSGPPGSTSDPTATYTGKTLTAFEQGKRSDGGYLNLSDGSKSLSNFNKSKRPSEPNFSSMDRRKNKISLADLHGDRRGSASTQEKFFPSKDSGIGTSADLVLDQDGRATSPFHSPSPCPSPSPSLSPTPYSRVRKSSAVGYDHLGPPPSPGPPRTPSPHITYYDHLSSTEKTDSAGSSNCPPIPPRSGVSLGDPYVDV